MKTIREIYDEIFSNKENFYYPHAEFLKMDTWTEENAFEFIQKYFAMGSKEIFCEGINYQRYKRSIHTVSLYALGIFLHKHISKEIDGNNNQDKVCEQHQFLYIWYMTCLYHDMGYAYEKNQRKLSKECEDLDGFIEFIVGTQPCLFYRKDNSLESLCRNYYKYIYETRGHIDHGIAGGIVLYHRLIKNYEDQKIKLGVPDQDEFIDEKTGVLFSKYFFKDYKQAATLIARHNMWYASEDDAEKIKEYKKAGLEKLILKEGEEKISCDGEEEDKMLFLLCFADTIEPLKVYSKCDPLFVLEHLKIGVTKNHGDITVNFYLDASALKVSVLEERIKSLESFLNVECEETIRRDDEVKIGIKFIKMSACPKKQ